MEDEKGGENDAKKIINNLYLFEMLLGNKIK